MKKTTFNIYFVFVLCLMCTPILSQETSTTNTNFKPTWESLSNYQFPEWFRDAKFGIWAHWGAQCQAEHDDWYGRNMYIEKTAQYRFTERIGTETSRQYRFHLDKYGHPSEFGFKDVINEWKAENFDADALMALYKKGGARYFMAMANHHDNFDNYNSKYQPWNSVAIGPKKDLIGLWSAAARKEGLRFGVSVHASHAWSWYETSQGADTEGSYKGVQYDGNMTKEDGIGKWWEGLDPQDLYAQNHVPSKDFKLEWSWNPEKGSSTPDKAYMQKFHNRVIQLWDDYQPDQIYFDDFVMPFHEIDPNFGLNLAAYFYNSSTKLNGKNEAVMNTKMLSESQRKALVYDVERSKAGGILPEPWQTDTCIGHWHYDRNLYYRNGYKQAKDIIPMLADIVSKNGNLMLNLPLRGDGTLDNDEIKIITEIGEWLTIYGEAIYETRPWKIYGEGPSTRNSDAAHTQSDMAHSSFSSEDIRFTVSKDNTSLYAIVLASPTTGNITIKSLAKSASTKEKIKSISLIGFEGKIQWNIDNAGLHVIIPNDYKLPSNYGFAIKIFKKN